MVRDTKYWVWLSSLVKIPLRMRLRLLEYFGDPAYLWEATEAEIRSLNLCNKQTLKALTDKESRKDTNRLFDEIRKCDAGIVTLKDTLYPELLKNIPDPPIVLFYKGNLERNEPCVAIVGSRNATVYGLDTAVRLAEGLASQGLTVVSGMARGIDTKAHMGALNGNGRTIAVLGCGIDIAYPFENARLVERISRSGAVISEYLPGMPPLSYNFPARNRIISGLALGVIIVEAGEKSGSLITADFALEQGRDVFAVPGNITSSNSSGANNLIKDGAKMVTDVCDILDELKIADGTNNNSENTKRRWETMLKGDEKSIAEKLVSGPVHIDSVAAECGISVQLAGSILVMLELSGFVEQLPGKFYKLAK